MGGSQAWEFAVRLTTLAVKSKLVTKFHKGPRTWTDSSDVRPKIRKADVRFVMCNTINLYRAGSLMTVTKKYQNIS
jgi:hypothetical protein